MVKQQKAFFLLTFVQMWRFFSSFGMRALLILYMVDALRLSDAHAFGINAVFLGMAQLSGIFGGILADRILGLRRAIQMGALFIAMGYLGFLFTQGIYFALPMIVVGASLFGGNIAALLGEVYEENDPKRAKGFTIFYMVQNLGAFVSTLVCAVIANLYGFKVGFAVAAAGTLLSCITLFLGRNWIKHLGSAPKGQEKKKWWMPSLFLIFALAAFAIHFQAYVLPLLPWITVSVFIFFALKLLKSGDLPKEKIRLFLVYLGAMILFFGVEEQICSSLVLFSERVTDRSFFGWTIPSSVLMSVNPVIILLFGTLFAKKRFRLFLPFLLVALAFGALAFVCLQGVSLPFASVMGMVALVSLAELMIGPVVMSYAAGVAPKGKAGSVMSMLPIASSLAFLLSGKFSKMVAISEGSSSLYTYGLGFGKIALIVLIGGIVLELLMTRYCKAKSLALK
jgi:proton-dependent oligopeptide transporter, POT family